jgi:hypothetical protein
MMIMSLNFHVGSLRSVRLSDPIKSGSSARKTTSAANSETSVGDVSKDPLGNPKRKV